jgi:hypothetical protein
MNKKYLFLYNEYAITFIRLDEDFNDPKNHQKINLEILNNNENKLIQTSLIKELRVGADPNIILIILEHFQNPYAILTWNIKHNLEEEYTTSKMPFEILWDFNGVPFIIHKDCVELSRRRCKVTVFDYQDLDEVKEATTGLKSLNDKGHQFDGKNHNWMIF